MIRAIKTFIKDPEPSAKHDDVVPGLNILDGVVRLEEPLRSPVRGQNCAAFFYRSFLVMTGGRAPTIHKIREAEGYAQFALEMEGGTIRVEPSKAPSFDHTAHQELGKRYGKEFQGVEEVIMPGARVRVRGRVKRVDNEMVMVLKEVTVLEKQAVSSGVVGDRKRRRKKK